MKTQKLRRKSAASINNSRWAAYVTAGAATALAGVDSAEADIHYSGTVNQFFAVGAGAATFALDNGAQIHFANTSVGSGAAHGRPLQGSGSGAALFRIDGAAMSNMFRGFAAGPYRYPSNLGSGVNVSAGAFSNHNGNFFATLAFGAGYTNSQFLKAGTGFIGFRFNSGSGIEYGWARVTMNGSPGNAFTLVDFAWADAGTLISTGQTAVPEPGSLGLLAVGATGLLLWRKRRSQTARP